MQRKIHLMLILTCPLCLAAGTLLNATGGVANALAEQKPFAAAGGFTVEARMNASDGPRHPYGLSLVSVGEGPVLAVGERQGALDFTVTAVAGGKSVPLNEKVLLRPAGEDLSRLKCEIAYDAARGVVRCTVGEGPKVSRVEFPAPADLKGESYRIVPSQVPSALRVAVAP